MLLIEDDALDARFVRSSLARAGDGQVCLTHVRTIEEARRETRAQRFDVVLLDLNLPDGVGEQCVDRVRALDPSSAIVVLSGRDDEQFALSILNRGVQDYLVKGDGDGATILRAIRYAQERKRSESRLEYLVRHDTLTGIPNRQYFREQLARTLSRIGRNDRLAALVFLDVDNFKQINDAYGHDFGDRLLKIVAKRLAESVRSGDMVARLGGDEFALLLEDLESEEDVEPITEKLLTVFEKPLTVSEKSISVSCSIGLTLINDGAAQAEDLLKNADMAMYEAKEAGRCTYRLFSPQMREKILQQHEFSRAVQEALSDDQFSLAYQPQVDASSGNLIGVEALLRWHDPKLGWVSPAAIVAAAEDAGLMQKLGEWVLDRACAQHNAWRLAGIGSIPLSVNASPIQFAAKNFVDTVFQALKVHEVPPEMLTIEITESCYMEETDRVVEHVENLRARGVKIAIDDFGVGFSCLSYLRRFPVDALKIDRSFTAELGQEPDGGALSLAIISVARHLGLGVIAEGVETQFQLDFLLDNDCPLIQGRYFGMPALACELPSLLNTIRKKYGHGTRARLTAC